jgi:hypothetical protein
MVGGGATSTASVCTEMMGTELYASRSITQRFLWDRNISITSLDQPHPRQHFLDHSRRARDNGCWSGSLVGSHTHPKRAIVMVRDGSWVLGLEVDGSEWAREWRRPVPFLQDFHCWDMGTVTSVAIAVPITVRVHLRMDG